LNTLLPQFSFFSSWSPVTVFSSTKSSFFSHVTLTDLMFLILQIQMKHVRTETSASQGMNVMEWIVQETVSTADATYYQQHSYQFNYRNSESITVVSFEEFESEMLLLSSTSHHPTQHGGNW